MISHVFIGVGDFARRPFLRLPHSGGRSARPQAFPTLSAQRHLFRPRGSGGMRMHEQRRMAVRVIAQ